MARSARPHGVSSARKAETSRSRTEVGAAFDGLWPLAADAYPFAHDRLLDQLGRMAARPGSRVGSELPERAEWEAEPHPDGRSAADEPPHAGHLATYRALVRIQHELRFLDMHVSDHPMRVLRQEARRARCLTTTDAQRRVGRFVRVAAVIAATRRIVSESGRIMQFVTLEDEHGLLEAVLFPGVRDRIGERITTPGPFLVEGTMAHDEGHPHLIVARVVPFHRRARPYAAL